MSTVSQGYTLPGLPDIHDKILKQRVFNHSSVDGVSRPNGTRSRDETEQNNNERLACLGANHIKSIATVTGYEIHPFLRKGELTEFISRYSSNAQMAEWAETYDLVSHLRVHEANGDTLRGNTSTRSQVFQAYVGAVFQEDRFVGLEEWLPGLIKYTERQHAAGGESDDDAASTIYTGDSTDGQSLSGQSNVTQPSGSTSSIDINPRDSVSQIGQGYRFGASLNGASGQQRAGGSSPQSGKSTPTAERMTRGPVVESSYSPSREPSTMGTPKPSQGHLAFDLSSLANSSPLGNSGNGEGNRRMKDEPDLDTLPSTSQKSAIHVRPYSPEEMSNGANHLGRLNELFAQGKLVGKIRWEEEAVGRDHERKWIVSAIYNGTEYKSRQYQKKQEAKTNVAWQILDNFCSS